MTYKYAISFYYDMNHFLTFYTERCTSGLCSSPGCRTTGRGVDETRGQGGQTSYRENIENGEQETPAGEQPEEDSATRCERYRGKVDERCHRRW